jgi:hypothetical protein
MNKSIYCKEGDKMAPWGTSLEKLIKIDLESPILTWKVWSLRNEKINLDKNKKKVSEKFSSDESDRICDY